MFDEENLKGLNLKKFGFDFSIFPEKIIAYKDNRDRLHRQHCSNVKSHFESFEVENFVHNLAGCCMWNDDENESLGVIFGWPEKAATHLYLESLVEDKEGRYQEYAISEFNIYKQTIDYVLTDTVYSSYQKNVLEHFKSSLENLKKTIEDIQVKRQAWSESDEALTYLEVMNVTYELTSGVGKSDDELGDEFDDGWVFLNAFDYKNVTDFTSFLDALELDEFIRLQKYLKIQREKEESDKFFLVAADNFLSWRLWTAMKGQFKINENYIKIPYLFKPCLDALKFDYAEVTSVKISVLETCKQFYDDGAASLQEAYDLASIV